MAPSIYALIWAVALILPRSQCWSTNQQVTNILEALASLEYLVNRMDQALQDMHYYLDVYSEWSECSVSCGLGTKVRHKLDCDENCEEVLYCNAHPCPAEPKRLQTRYATCAMRPNEELGPEGTVRGLVTFEQKEQGPLYITVSLTGFQEQPEWVNVSLLDHGFHAHQYGDLSGGCGTAGGHFNPKNVSHGGRMDAIRHVGDFGNIRQTLDGTFNDVIIETRASLFGENSIIGRAMVVHRDQDDLGRGGNAGSQTTGNAGPRLACCVIGVA